MTVSTMTLGTMDKTKKRLLKHGPASTAVAGNMMLVQTSTCFLNTGMELVEPQDTETLEQSKDVLIREAVGGKYFKIQFCIVLLLEMGNVAMFVFFFFKCLEFTHFICQVKIINNNFKTLAGFCCGGSSLIG